AITRVLACALAMMLYGNTGLAASNGFAFFRSFCVDTHADPNAALNRANAAGGRPLTDVEVSKNPDNSALSPSDGRLLSIPGGTIILLAHSREDWIFREGDMVSSCSIIVSPPASEGLYLDVAQWAGVPADPKEPIEFLGS